MTLVSLKEAARKVGLSTYELRRGAIAGRYPFHQAGNRYLFDTDMLSQVIRQQMETSLVQRQKEVTGKCG